ISFSPTPQCFFGREQATLSNFKEKHQLLDRLGVDKHLLIYFNQTFSELKAKDFIQQVLLDKLNMKHCLIGDDFRFGKKRQGDLGLLQSLSKTKGFSVENTQSVLCNDCRASSSEIRTLLAHGDLAAVTQMLGREFSISGKIIHGQQKGRTIGFPTINIPIKRKISPVLGVFATTVEVQGSVFQGVCNIGNRPTINGEEILLEVFLFDFDRDVYGFEAKVVFKHKIRDEEKFDSFKALKQQIELDTQQAKAFFKV
ncbi:MAG TPA: riboflavin biosynthesis protein RibF, partial [Gammaproteobacteria bacterium]|nr:riboflavin biosynthesis protein RibF [Gammaproteobacteria bacterium]